MSNLYVVSNLIEVAKSVESYVIEARHRMHKHPETRWETSWTRDFIEGKVQSMGFEPKMFDGGIVVDIDTIPGGEKILCRADFDALPVTEKTGLPYASVSEGKSHACGHDCGTAMLLGTLQAISEHKIQLTKNIRVVFQDAEENPGTDPRPESGGEVLVKEGVLEGVNRAYALHIDNMPESTFGAFRSCSGAMLGNSGRIYFKVNSSGGHVAKPHTGVNALRVVNAIMNQLNTFIARHFDPLQPATLEPAVVNAGKGSNVMPAEAEVWYGFRTMLPRREHEAWATTIEMEAIAVAASMDAKITDVQLIHGHPALVNDYSAYTDAAVLLMTNGEEVTGMNPLLGGEDFAHYAMRVPSAMFMLGAHTPNSGGDHHSPTFNPDESVFWKGVHFWLLLATS